MSLLTLTCSGRQHHRHWSGHYRHGGHRRRILQRPQQPRRLPGAHQRGDIIQSFYVNAVIDCDIALPLHVRAPVWTRVWATARPQEGQEVVVPLAAAPLAEVRAPLLAGEVRRHPGDGHTGPMLPGGGGRPTPRTPRTPASTTTTATSTAPRPGPPPAPPTPTPASSLATTGTACPCTASARIATVDR